MQAFLILIFHTIRPSDSDTRKKEINVNVKSIYVLKRELNTLTT